VESVEWPMVHGLVGFQTFTRSFGYRVGGLCSDGSRLFDEWYREAMSPVLRPFLKAVDAPRKMTARVR